MVAKHNKANKLNKNKGKLATADSKDEKTEKVIEIIADAVKANAKVAHARSNNQLLPLQLSLKLSKG